jgi:hypothetical protein
MSTPERIWDIYPNDGEPPVLWRTPCPFPVDDGEIIEYVRADIAAAEIEQLREKVEDLQDTFQNGVRVNEKTNTFELTWTKRQLTKAREDAYRLLRELNFMEDK